MRRNRGMRCSLIWRKLLVAGCLILASCAKESLREETVRGDDFLHLNFLWSESRADMCEEGAGTFTENDRIGIYVTNGAERFYRELVYDGSEWLPRLRRSEFGEGLLTLSAHYPALPSGESMSPEDYPYSLAGEQDENTWSQEDLLFAGAEVPSGNNQVSLVFHHVFHRLKITLKGDEKDASVWVRSKDGSVNLLTGETQVSENAGYEWIRPMQKAEGSYWALIYPQRAAPYQGEEGLVKVTSYGKETIVRAPEKMADGKVLEWFEPGKQLQINLNITQETEELAGRTLWVYGVHAPDFPGKEHIPTVSPGSGRFPVGEWFRYDWSFLESQYLTWKEGCGWYDCNKSIDYQEGDKNICWAASASNLIIWWMVHNKAYIDAYDREYGAGISTSSGSILERPAPEFRLQPDDASSVNRSPVFEFFKAHFPDKGSWNRAGVNWFLNGNPKDLQTQPDIASFPGFFCQVFGPDDAIAVDSKRQPQCEEFNQFLLDALLSRKAIGLNVSNMGGAGNHALVIWGAEVDEKGQVSHVYYCDNNYADQDAGGAVMQRAEIAYVEDNSIPEAGIKTYTYLKMLDGDDGSKGAKFKVLSLCAVDLRRDIWSAKYPQVSSEE